MIKIIKEILINLISLIKLDYVIIFIIINNKGYFMINESIFDDIKQINGYLGVGLSQYTGELLLFNKSDSNINIEETSIIFNDVFRDTHALSKKLSLGHTKIMEISTEKSKILMACSGENTPVHLHLFAIFKEDGNVALAKMILPKIMNKAVSELS